MNTISLNRSIPYPATQVTFAGNDTNNKSLLKSLLTYASIGLCIGTGIKYAPSAYEYMKLRSCIPPTENYNPTITQNIGWPENVQVFASQSQRYISTGATLSAMDEYNIKIDGTYSRELIEKLKEGKAKNFYEAHKLVKQEGLKEGKKLSSGIVLPFSQFPQETPGKVDAWNVDDKTKNRIILAIGGSDEENQKGLAGFSDEVSQLYSVPEENIIKIPNANRKSFREGLNKLAEKIGNTDPNNTEILIYYSGHGNTTTYSIPYGRHLLEEGEAIGITTAGFDENDLKKFVKDNLKNIKTVIIMDCCTSGAWIADNSPPKRNPHATFHRARSLA